MKALILLHLFQVTLTAALGASEYYKPAMKRTKDDVTSLLSLNNGPDYDWSEPMSDDNEQDRASDASSVKKNVSKTRPRLYFSDPENQIRNSSAQDIHLPFNQSSSKTLTTIMEKRGKRRRKHQSASNKTRDPDYFEHTTQDPNFYNTFHAFRNEVINIKETHARLMEAFPYYNELDSVHRKELRMEIKRQGKRLRSLRNFDLSVWEDEPRLKSLIRAITTVSRQNYMLRQMLRAVQG